MKIKRALSALLSTAIVFSLCTTGAYAINAEHIHLEADAQQLIIDSLGENYLNTATTQKVSNDLEMFEKASLADWVEISSVDTSGNITYKIPYVGVTSYINISKEESGDIVLNITEGNKHDNLIYKSDGQIILNGHTVTVQNVNSTTMAKNETPLINPAIPSIETRAGVYTRMFAVDPVLDGRGKPTTPSGFTYTGCSYSGKNVSFGEQIASLTTSAIISCIISAVAPLLPTIFIVAFELDDARTLLQLALNAKETQLQLIIDSYGGATAATVGISEYAKQNNNSLHSEWYYSISLGFNTYSLYTAAKRVMDAT